MCLFRITRNLDLIYFGDIIAWLYFGGLMIMDPIFIILYPSSAFNGGVMAIVYYVWQFIVITLLLVRVIAARKFRQRGELGPVDL